MFAILSTVHTTTQNTLSQLVFGRDAALNINQEAKCQSIIQFKQALINKVYQKEIRRRQYHLYYTGDKVLLKNAWKTKFDQDTFRVPYILTEVSRARKCIITDSYNLCNITLFKE